MDILTSLLFLVPRFILRYFYSEKTLAGKIEIAVCDDRRGVYLNGSEVPDAQIYVRVTNLTPFDVRIEKLWSDLRFVGGYVAALESRLSVVVKARTSLVVHLLGTMTGPQREFLERKTDEDIHKFLSDRQLRIGIEGELSCRVRRFQIFGRELITTNVEFVNFDFAQAC